MKKLKSIFLIALIAFVSVGFTSCQSIPFESKAKVQLELEQMQRQYEMDKQDALKTISAQKDGVIKAQENQLQEASNSLYGADYGFRFYTEPERLDIIINNRVKEAQSAIATAPTYEAIQKENERMALELDETKTSLETLKKTHLAVVEEKTLIAEEKDKQVEAVLQLEKKMADADALYIKNMTAKQGELNDLNNKIISMEKERADNQASIERMKTKLMWACGIAAVLCLAGAIYSPVGKDVLGTLAAVFGGATVGIPYIEGWHILVAILLVAAVMIGKFMYRHNISEKVNTNLIHAIEDTKQQVNNAEVVKTLKTNLKAWNGKYSEKNGEIVTVSDPTVEKYISEKLMETGRLDTKVVP